MFFRNLIVYRLPPGWSIAAAELEDKLARRALLPCGPFDMQSCGWVHASVAERYVHTTNAQHLIALGVEQKLLPGSIIRQAALERAKVLEAEQGYPVGRRQMRELKARVTEELRARALSRRRTTRAWIDPAHGWLVVDAASGARADELIATLRDTLGTLAVQLMETDRSPQQSMAAWLMLGDAPSRFTIDQDLELQALKNKAAIRYVRHPLDGKDIRSHLATGMVAMKLGLAWNDRIAFVLTDKLQLKRVQFLAISAAEAGESQLPPEEQFDIDFTLMAGELSRLLADLSEALGGAALAQAAAA